MSSAATDRPAPCQQAKDVALTNEIYRAELPTPPYHSHLLLHSTFEMVSNQDINKHREPGCTAITIDKKYYEVGNSFIKRTLRQHEWIIPPTTNWTPPASLPQRWKTDAAILLYLKEHTNIPLPRLQHTFEDDVREEFLGDYPLLRLGEFRHADSRDEFSAEVEGTVVFKGVL